MMDKTLREILEWIGSHLMTLFAIVGVIAIISLIPGLVMFIFAVGMLSAAITILEKKKESKASEQEEIKD